MKRTGTFTPLQVASMLLHYMEQGWHPYLGDKRILGVTNDKVLVETGYDEAIWAPLDLSACIVICKAGESIQLFPIGSISERPVIPIKIVNNTGTWVILLKDERKTS